MIHDNGEQVFVVAAIARLSKKKELVRGDM